MLTGVSCGFFNNTTDEIKYKNNVVENSQLLFSFILSEPKIIDTLDLSNSDFNYSVSKYIKGRYINYSEKKYLVKLNIHVINNLAFPKTAHRVLQEQLAFFDSFTNIILDGRLDTNKLTQYKHKDSIMTCFLLTQKLSDVKNLKKYYRKGVLLFFTNEYCIKNEVFSTVYYPFYPDFFDSLVEVKRYKWEKNNKID